MNDFVCFIYYISINFCLIEEASKYTENQHADITISNDSFNPLCHNLAANYLMNHRATTIPIINEKKEIWIIKQIALKNWFKKQLIVKLFMYKKIQTSYLNLKSILETI